MRKSLLFPAVTLALFAAGCVPPDGEEASRKKADEAEAGKAPPTLSEVFEAPNPLEAKDRPVAVRAKAAAGRVQELLASLDARIERMKAGEGRPAAARSDALEAARILKRQVELVGRDNWGLLLDARKLAAEWDRAERGHADTARDLRQAAAGVSAPENRAVLVAEAEAHERQARDVPRRRAACAAFIAALEKNAAFFAETERTLDLAAASIEANVAGGAPILENQRAEATDRQLQALLKLLEKFAAELRARDPAVEVRAAAEAARRGAESARLRRAEEQAETERVERRRQFLLSPAGRRSRVEEEIRGLSPPLHDVASGRILMTLTVPEYTCADCGEVHNPLHARGGIYAVAAVNRRNENVANLLVATEAQLRRRRELVGFEKKIRDDPNWAPTEQEARP